MKLKAILSQKYSAAIATALLLLTACALYQPFEVRPLDYVDFPEHVLILQSHGSFAERFVAMTQAYLDHGRWSPITQAAVAGQWTLFEWWTPGWQIVRFGIMAIVVVLAQRLSRRLGLTETGAFVTASWFVVAPAVVPSWVRLSTTEPVAIPFLLVACHLALRKPTAGTSVTFALMLLLVMWTKEIMVAAFALPILLFVLAADNGLQSPRWTRARFRWLLPAAFAFVIGSVPVIWAWRSAPSGAFASRYASSSISISDMFGGFLGALLPFAPISDRASTSMLVLAAFLILLLAGWRIALMPRETMIHRRFVLALGLGVPLLGAVIYSPWPFYVLRYAVPFAIAGALLSGQAASSMFRGSGLDRIVGAICSSVVMSFALAQAANESSKTRSLHRAFSESVVRVASLPGIDSVLVEVSASQFDSSGNFGPRFVSYARMLGLDWPAVRDVRCNEVHEERDRVLLLRVSVMCPSAPNMQAAIVQRHRRFDWPNPWPRLGSVTVSLQGFPP